jgi:hypothetical protein
MSPVAEEPEFLTPGLPLLSVETMQPINLLDWPEKFRDVIICDKAVVGSGCVGDQTNMLGTVEGLADAEV